ncbi:acyl carrier protein [Streptomyces sp. NPDC001260]|uniref:acyl carrier protein n=1 Tax=Streptomyces sp. NPDC001260 TaxID=3364551 RepID=UPI0036811384
MESLPQAHQQGGQDRTFGEQAAPASLAGEVAALWGEYLGGREVGPDDDFFTLGGNSLTGIKIIERVGEEYGVQLSVRDFYLAQTPTKVAELIEQGRTGA